MAAGNIRNVFLYNPNRVAIVDGSLRRLGDDSEAYEGSRAQAQLIRRALESRDGSVDYYATTSPATSTKTWHVLSAVAWVTVLTATLAP